MAALLPLLAYAARRTSGSPNQAPTAQLTAPSAGSSFAAGSSVGVTATATDADGKIARVDFYDGAALIGSDTRAPYAATWKPTAAGTHALKAVAVDNHKATGASATVGVTVTTARDTTAPSVPTGLVQGGGSSNSISLAWTAASDNVGVAAYDVFRNGALAGTTASTAYTDAGLAASTSYDYTVRARDAAGNASAQSATLSASTSAATSGGGARRVVGYFTQWGIYTSGYKVKDLEANGTAARLTHLTYAFGNVRNDKCEVGVLQSVDPTTGAGGDAYADYSRTYAADESVDGKADAWNQPLRGHWNQLKKLKAMHPGLKVLISLGGWTWSQGFADAARPENRQAFVASCIDAYIRGNLPAFDNAGGAGAAAGVFDGFDIDWEYPAACGLSCGTSEDATNFTALLAEFRRQLDAIRPGLVLSAAVGAGIDKIRVLQADQYQQPLDYVNVMTYDFHGSWESRTNFHSALFDSPNDPSTGDAALYNSNDAVQALLARGVPASKINLGLASYGRGWTKVANVNHGLYQSGAVASGSEGDGIEAYRVLKALGYPRYTDPDARTPWIYNGSTFWSYDDPASIADKMAYVQASGLGGAFLWDFAGDDAQGSLAAAMAGGLQ